MNPDTRTARVSSLLSLQQIQFDGKMFCQAHECIITKNEVHIYGKSISTVALNYGPNVTQWLYVEANGFVLMSTVQEPNLNLKWKRFLYGRYDSSSFFKLFSRNLSKIFSQGLLYEFFRIFRKLNKNFTKIVPLEFGHKGFSL